jgi:hypothetical protein
MSVQTSPGSLHVWPFAIPSPVCRLMRHLTYTEFGIILVVLRETAGRPSFPEWAQLTQQELADAKGVSVVQVRKSLRALEFGKRLIESKKVGRRLKYRIRLGRLGLLKPRARDTA